MHSLTLMLVITAVGISACSSDNGGTGYAAPSYGSAMPSSAPNSGGATLTVMNFFNWCSVEINGGTASTDATVTASVTSGSTATVVVTPASSSFQIGTDPWFGVDQNDGGAASGTDIGSGMSESSKAIVTITETEAARCVSVCCQEPGNSPTPCPTTNPCL